MEVEPIKRRATARQIQQNLPQQRRKTDPRRTCLTVLGWLIMLLGVLIVGAGIGLGSASVIDRYGSTVVIIAGIAVLVIGFSIVMIFADD